MAKISYMIWNGRVYFPMFNKNKNNNKNNKNKNNNNNNKLLVYSQFYSLTVSSLTTPYFFYTDHQQLQLKAISNIFTKLVNNKTVTAYYCNYTATASDDQHTRSFDKRGFLHSFHCLHSSVKRPVSLM